MAKLNILETSASVRLAVIGAPRSFEAFGPTHRSQPRGAGGFVQEHELEGNQAVGEAIHGATLDIRTNQEHTIPT